MKLLEALGLSNRAAQIDGEPFAVFLSCSFSPLHLETFLIAHLGKALPQRRIQVQHGIYGNLLHNVELVTRQNVPHAVIVMEWFDLDPRLGVRSLGGWGVKQVEDIVDTAATFMRRFKESLSALPSATTAVISLPALPLPPVFKTHTNVVSAAEARLLGLIADLQAWAAERPNLRVLHRDALADLSPMRERWDIKSDLTNGFPYTTAHADALASLAVSALLPAPRRKGIISDLDDTFWSGIVGEIGVPEVTWTLEHGTQIHGLYQQLLASLAETGTLVAIASKNDPAVVEEALKRSDLIMPAKTLFPIDVHWGAKSESVARILKAWNVGASSVVFIDDSDLELAEVQAAFPEMECKRFPKKDPAAVLQLLKWLRDEFGRESASQEDKIRRESLRSAEVFQTEAAQSDPEEFLRSLGATVTISDAGRQDQRAFELVNKTNQFNINGARYTPDAWNKRGERAGDFVFVVAYEDRFGPLGKIAVMSGQAQKERVELEDWVISCRAFSRRIEYQCLRTLFDVFDANELILHYKETARNGPSKDLLKVFFDALTGEEAGLRLTRERFEKRCPMLYHKVSEPAGSQSVRSDRGEAEAVFQGGISKSK